MRKIFLFILTLFSVMTFAIDWNSYEWVASGNADYANKFKVAKAMGQTVVNIQNPWGDGWGIYTNFPAGDIVLTGLEEGKYKVEGAGVLLYVTSFTKKETSLKVTCGGADYEFTVYYEDGEGDVAPDPEPDPDPTPDPEALTPATFYGAAKVEISGEQVAFDWSITRNADKTLTFEISWDKDIAGVVPQICIDGAYSTMPNENKKAVFTTKETYTDGATFNGFFWIAYTGNAAKIEITGYKIGDSNTKPGTPDPDPEPEPDPDPDPDPETLTPATFYGTAQAEIDGSQVAFLWSITRNADKTLTFEIAWNSEIEGVVPQICLGGNYSEMTLEGKTAKLTTTETYEDGAELGEAFLYVAYAGGSVRIDIVGYKIGDSNTKPETPDPDPEPEDPEPEDPGDQGLNGVQNPKNKAQKVLVDGQLVIIKKGVHYTANGIEIK